MEHFAAGFLFTILLAIGSIGLQQLVWKGFDLVRERRKLKAFNASGFGMSAENAAQALRRFASVGVSLQDYPDKDKDGVPDAFQRRKPLSELLEFDKQPAEPEESSYPGRIWGYVPSPNEYVVAIELPARPPRKGEYFILSDQVMRSTINYSDGFKTIIIKAFRDCCPEDLVELSK